MRHARERKHHFLHDRVRAVRVLAAAGRIQYGVVAQLLQYAADFRLEEHEEHDGAGVDDPAQQRVQRAHAQHVAEPPGHEHHDDALDDLRDARLPGMPDQRIEEEGQQRDVNHIDQAQPVHNVPHHRGQLLGYRAHTTPPPCTNRSMIKVLLQSFGLGRKATGLISLRR